ncbi:uncharacterized protein GGS22DRAFT_186716 [Annulohypoxylon maeteangense]|uniref:uncharacterized protein n=1 Tax=Annulohypoxylon maeteangense TaxID=1927788 RepID=UPI002007EA7D|nr:uncharacterized protein GGS22DRAFT_186716 [Annulohypoxylon maeteangense]KAI0886646.1 hypothetical protein GGS22DRAFT_186716 [Annulohypoxylon maeteangense]
MDGQNSKLPDVLNERDELLGSSFDIANQLEQNIRQLEQENKRLDEKLGEVIPRGAALMEIIDELREDKKTIEEKLKNLVKEKTKLLLDIKGKKDRNKALLAKAADRDRENEKLLSDAKEKDEAIAKLNVDLDEVKDRLSSFTSYDIETTPKELSDQYSGLVANVKDIIESRIAQLNESLDLRDESIFWASMNKQHMRAFKDYLMECKDLYDTAYSLSNTEISSEIIISCILRFISDAFAGGFSIIHPKYAKMVETVGNTLKNHPTGQSADEFAANSWKRQTMHALLEQPDVKEAQLKHRNWLLERLSRMLRFIIQDRDQNVFLNQISTRIIDPALKLQHGFFTSIHNYSLEVNTLRPGRYFKGDIQRLDDFDCVNGLDEFRKFNVDEVEDKEKLGGELYIACSLIPALMVTNCLRTGDTKGARLVVNKEQLLVFWKKGEAGKMSMFYLDQDLSPWLLLVMDS